MKPPPFDYEAAATIDEATELLAEHGDEAKLLAGGQSLLPLLALRLARPAFVVDIGRVTEAQQVTTHGDNVRIGALVRQRSAERNDTIATAAPLLADALPLIGHAAIRNRGTIGGSLAHADPAAELPAAALASGATFVARRAGSERRIAAGDFYVSYLTTALAPDEMLCAIEVPTAGPSTGACYAEFSRRHGDFALVGVAAMVTVSGAAVTDARVALAGVGNVPESAAEACAQAIGQQPSPSLWTEVAAAAAAGLSPPDDLHGTAAYRRKLVRVLTQKALTTAVQRAGGAQ